MYFLLNCPRYDSKLHLFGIFLNFGHFFALDQHRFLQMNISEATLLVKLARETNIEKNIFRGQEKILDMSKNGRKQLKFLAQVLDQHSITMNSITMIALKAKLQEGF